MKRREIPGWVCTRISQDGLSVYHHPREEYWAPIASAFFRGSQSGLARVESAQTARVYRGDLPDAGGPCYFKQYLQRDRLDPIKDFFRASRARRALLNEIMCTGMGFHLPRSRCLAERRIGGWLTFCVLVNEAIEDAPTVRDWLTKPGLRVLPDRAERINFLCELGRELGRWHAAGLHHGDLRLGNVLGRRKGTGYTFSWLDNERNRRYSGLPFRLRVHNLMRINFEPLGISASDRMRFWRAYLETAAVPPGREKDLLRAVADATYKRRKKRGWA